MTKPLIGLAVALLLGFACRTFSIPSPAPPVVLGALLVIAMILGYQLVDRWLAQHPARHAANCGGPSGRTAEEETL